MAKIGRTNVHIWENVHICEKVRIPIDPINFSCNRASFHSKQKEKIKNAGALVWGEKRTDTRNQIFFFFFFFSFFLLLYLALALVQITLYYLYVLIDNFIQVHWTGPILTACTAGQWQHTHKQDKRPELVTIGKTQETSMTNRTTASGIETKGGQFLLAHPNLG